MPVNLPALTPDQEEVVEEAFGKPPAEILAKNVTVTDILTLKGRAFLNDTVITRYLEMIQARAEGAIYCFSTFFYTLLEEYGHSGVSRWTKNTDIFSYSMVMVPVHVPGKVGHWCLAVVDMEAKKIMSFDSLGGNHKVSLAK